MKEEAEGIGRPAAHGTPEIGAASGSHFSDPQDAERPQGLPEGREADPQEFGQFSFGRKFLAKSKVFLVDQFLDLADSAMDDRGLSDRFNLHQFQMLTAGALKDESLIYLTKPQKPRYKTVQNSLTPGHLHNFDKMSRFFVRFFEIFSMRRVFHEIP
jgi:hypothetical protein